MTDTPLTDAHVRQLADGLAHPHWVAFARGLERENADLRAKLARLDGLTNWVCSCGGTDCKGQQENASLRADKERLDWLESAAKDLICARDDRGITIGVASNFQNYATNAATFRSAIDAARKKQP